MKSIKILIFLLIGLNSYAQNIPFDTITQKITYSNVFNVKGTKSENILKAKEWFAHFYKSSNNVIQFFEESTGKIIGKSTFHAIQNIKGVGDVPIGYISYTITVLSKDEKLKYVVTDFYHEGRTDCPDYGDCENMISSKNYPTIEIIEKKYNGYFPIIEANMKAVNDSFKSYVLTDDNW